MSTVFKQKTRVIGGYTLVEVIIYIALFVAISLLVMQTLLTMMRTGQMTILNHSLQEGGYGAMEGMVRIIRSADSVDKLTSTFDTNDGALSLVLHDSSGNQVTKKLYVSTYYYLNWWTAPHVARRAVQIDQNGSLLSPMTDKNTEVESLVFRLIETPHSQAVKIEMTVRDIRSVTPRTETYYDTIILRGSY